MRLSCEYTHFLGLAAPQRAPLTRRRWDRGSVGRKVVCFSRKVARFRRKGVRFLSPAALFSHPRCVVSCQSSRRCSRPSRCLCRPSSAPPPPPPLVRSFARALRANSTSFRFSAFTARFFAFNRLIVRRLWVKDSPRKRVLNIFVIICCTVYCG